MKRRKISWIRKAAAICGLLILGLGAGAHGQEAGEDSRAEGNLIVTASGFKTVGGEYILNIFDSEKGYPLDSMKAVNSFHGKVTHETMEIELEGISFGIYVVTILHDEDANGKMTRGFLGMPKEAIGISNNPRSYFGAPDYEDAVFQFQESGMKLAISLHSH